MKNWPRWPQRTASTDTKGNKTIRDEEKPKSFEDHLKENIIVNPFSFVKSNDDVLNLTAILTKHFLNDFPDGAKEIDARQALINALALYIYNETNTHDHNFVSIWKLLLCANLTKEEAESGSMSILDILFDNLTKRHVDHPAVLQYNTFKLYTNNNFEMMSEVVDSAKASMIRLGWYGPPTVNKLLRIKDENENNPEKESQPH